MSRPLIVLAIVVALCTSAASVVYQRPGDVVEWCNTQDDGCPAPRLTGGYPIEYWFDQPGVSVENTLGFEDEWAPGWFVANTAVHALVLSGAALIVTGSRRQLRNPAL